MGIGLAALGVALGLGAAYAGSRLLRSMVFGVTTTDPVTFVGVILIVMLTAVAASLGPALRATRADPMQALRAES
jgi:ABC-type antimicrobial peptide transport system permease subunit